MLTNSREYPIHDLLNIHAIFQSFEFLWDGSLMIVLTLELGMTNGLQITKR